MSANYVLLEKITVGAAGATSVTFSNIPQTGYTDLIVKYTGRANDNGVSDGFALLFNGSTTNYTGRQLSGNGSTATSVASTGTRWAGVNGTASTANTFSNGEFYIPNYTSSNYKTYTLDYVIENNSSTKNMALSGALWSDNAAVTSIELIDSGKTLLQHCTFYLYGIAKFGTTPTIQAYATGGDIIETDGTYWYHAFLASGIFVPAKGLSCDVLVVAGGGGGGNNYGGGGGAGGVSYQTGRSAISATSYTVTVGAGGTAETSGGNSVFDTITSNGGGSSLSYGNGNGGAGGSGAGGPGPTGLGGASNQGNTGGATGYGFAGGNSSTTGGGGGGAGAVGATAASYTPTAGKNGGDGLNTWSSWLSITGLGASGYIAGGGGSGIDGSSGTGGAGGAGGGGKGQDTTAAGNAVANTGGGGGAGKGSGGGAAGTGGSGLVIVRYAI
jgi:hypothetical protein